MASAWYYVQGGSRLGPISSSDLRRLAASNQLQPTDLIWKEGMPTWSPAGSMTGLFAAASPNVEPPSIPPATTAPPPSLVSAEPNVAQPAHEFQFVQDEFTQTKAESSRAENPASKMGRQARDVAVSASTDAFKAFKVMAANPVGGLRTAFDTLGPRRAMAVGIVFAIVFDFCILVGVGLMLGDFASSFSEKASARSERSHQRENANAGVGIASLFKLGILGLVPLLGTTAGCAVVRKIFRGKGDFQSDIFIAGASLLPFGVAVAAIGLLGLGNIEVSAALGIFALTTTILMMYSGCTSLQQIPDAAATLSVPLMILADVYVCKIIVTSLVRVWAVYAGGSSSAPFTYTLF